MVNLVSELRETRRLIDEVYAQLPEERKPPERPPLGIMVEVPAAVFRIDELAGDPLGALLMLGLGVAALSVASGSILRVKQVIRRFSAGLARELWEGSLQEDSARGVRTILTQALENEGLGGLVRPGK
jgi:signal transduction protein with GAF and PtsI domain